jgi:hypothetical protein
MWASSWTPGCNIYAVGHGFDLSICILDIGGGHRLTGALAHASFLAFRVTPEPGSQPNLFFRDVWQIRVWSYDWASCKLSVVGYKYLNRSMCFFVWKTTLQWFLVKISWFLIPAIKDAVLIAQRLNARHWVRELDLPVIPVTVNNHCWFWMRSYCLEKWIVPTDTGVGNGMVSQLCEDLRVIESAVHARESNST